jgi:hypothetical protein
LLVARNFDSEPKSAAFPSFTGNRVLLSTSAQHRDDPCAFVLQPDERVIVGDATGTESKA